MSHWISPEEAADALARGTGAGVHIAIIDSGVEAGHPDLANLHLNHDLAIDAHGLELQTCPGNGTDSFGHGTAIAGILRELAPQAALGSFRVLGANLKSRTPIICEGARQAIDLGYHILNCSFGCTRAEQVLAYKDWIDEAYLKGRHIVAAANNQDFSRREWPAHFSSVLGVSFLRSDRLDELFRRQGTLIEFAAHGEDVDVAWAGRSRRRVTGSSFAAPVIAALLARLLSVYPDLSPLQAKAILQRIARPAN